jgi:O-antigen/teichoic acid export membrane protein
MRAAARRGIAWTGLASAVLGGLDAIATLLLLRYWLGPADYGVAALAITLFPLLDIVADGGFTSAIVQRDHVDRGLLSSAAWAAVGFAVATAGVACGLGAVIAHVHGRTIVVGLFAGYAAKLLLGTAALVPVALLRRELAFRGLSMIKLAAGIAEFAAKLAVAAAGFGVWCFVAAALAKVIVTVLLAQVARPWRPALHFRRAEAAACWRIGGRTSSSQILFHLYSNADYQIVSWYFGAAATGLYRAAYELVLEPAKLLSYVVVEVAFPVFARLRTDRAALREQFLAFTRQNLWVLAPLLAVMAVIPGELLALFFGARWQAAAPAVQILCVVGGLRALSFLVPPLLDGIGRPELTLRYAVIAAIAVPLSQLAAAAWLGDAFGWHAVAVAWAVGYPIAFAALIAMALRELELPAASYLRAAWPPILVGLALAAAGLVTRAALPSW